jgi:hypothetical protein
VTARGKRPPSGEAGEAGEDSGAPGGAMERASVARPWRLPTRRAFVAMLGAAAAAIAGRASLPAGDALADPPRDARTARTTPTTRTTKTRWIGHC